MGEFNVNKTTGDLEQTAGADNEAKANRIDIAPEFSTTTAYAKGDLVYYNGTLYEFNQAHAAGAWNASHADAVSVSNIVSRIDKYDVIATATGDGVKTFSALLNSLYTYRTSGLVLSMDGSMFQQESPKNYYTINTSSTPLIRIETVRLDESNSLYLRNDITTNNITNLSANVLASGLKIELRKYH